MLFLKQWKIIAISSRVNIIKMNNIINKLTLREAKTNKRYRRKVCVKVKSIGKNDERICKNSAFYLNGWSYDSDERDVQENSSGGL